MGEVGTEIRVLQLFETFARIKRPLRLSELAAAMDMPVSSCFALVRRLAQEGHLFEPVAKRGYYPTGQLRVWTNLIATNDPILQQVNPILEKLRDDTNETVMFGQMSGNSVIYLSAFQSRSAIRMAGRIGILRPCHAVAMGKALLSAMEPKERAALLKKHRFVKLTPATISSAAELEVDLVRGAKRGYFISQEESVEGAMALGASVLLAEQNYAVQVVGPIARIESNVDRIAAALMSAVDELQLSGDEPVAE